MFSLSISVGPPIRRVFSLPEPMQLTMTVVSSLPIVHWASRLSRQKASLVLAILLVLGFMIYHLIVLEMRHTMPHGIKVITLADWKWSHPLDRDQLCHFPNPDPFDPSILPYIEETRDLHCKWEPPFTTIDSDGVLHFNVTAIKERGYTISSLRCFYQSIKRKNGTDDDVEYGVEKPMTGFERISDVEYVSVWCKNWLGWNVYSTVLAHPRTLDPLPKSRSQQDRRVNILVFGVDSLSRLNALRQLPRTYRYLTRKMGAIVLEGLNKVGDNTYPNMVALLTGRKVYSEELVYKPVGEYHDDWPLIWKNFSQAGYVTMYAEDLPEFNVFNYLASGFNHSPTDHYLRPFWLAVESSSAFKVSSDLCFLEKPKHVVQMDYVRRFLEKYQHVPYFALSFITEISHDYLNLVGVADDDFHDFLSSLYERGLLNETFVLFMGDHGHRFDSIRITPIGHFEENAPFCALFVPPSLRQKYPQAMSALRLNSRRFVTMYDFYDTLVDILRFSSEGSDLGGDERPVLFRGQSLFTKIPINRTCALVGITHNYCICEEEESFPLAHPRTENAARVLIDAINARTAEYREICAHLALLSTRSAVLLKLRNSPKMICLRLVVEATPGNGLFEGTVCFQGSANPSLENDISRISRFSGQDSCIKENSEIHDKSLRKYCFCK